MPGRLESWVTTPGAEELDLDFVRLYNYTFSRRLGRGRNAVVFEATDFVDDQKYAIKVFKRPTDRVRRQIDVLEHLRGGQNIISFIETLKDDQGIPRALVLEAVDHTDFRSLYPRFNISDIQYYTAELLKALCFCHEQGIMHRDIRPHNVVINHQSKQLRLVGWGSAKFWQPDTQHSARVSLFKAPELLVDFRKYDYSLDMWGFGTMLASLIFRKEPFFHGNSLSDQLVKITKVLGSDGLFEFVNDCDIELDDFILQELVYQPRRPWSSFINAENERNESDEVFDLLDQLLRYNPRERLSASEALNHPYYSLDTPESPTSWQNSDSSSP